MEEGADRRNLGCSTPPQLLFAIAVALRDRATNEISDEILPASSLDG